MQNSVLEHNSNDSVDVMTVDNNVSINVIEEKDNIKTEILCDNDLDPALKIPKIDYESLGEFCFESDILALKGNNDYKNTLEAIVILEAQKEQAIKDLSVLKQLKEEALANPLDFVERLKKKENMNIPTAQKIYPVPTIDWGKYALSGDPSVFKRRQLSKIAIAVKKNLKRKSTNALEAQENETEHWTTEEEKQLEELLIKFPPERNEFARWEKISSFLNNHSVAQIANKAQECFAKLAENDTLLETENSNFPRKLPNIVLRTKQKSTHEKDGYPDSLKTDDDSLDSKVYISDDEEIAPELHDTPEYQELLLYKKLLKKKIKASTMTHHLSFKCAWCKSEPIIGIRYHCTDCTDSVDFCEECAEGGYEIEQHSSDHQFEEIHHSNTGFLDHDYMHFLGNDYNYLDPNYMPAT